MRLTCLATLAVAKVAVEETTLVLVMVKLGVQESVLHQKDVAGVKVAKEGKTKFQLSTIGVLTLWHC